MTRVLIGTVGYHNLRDYSLGPKLLPKLRAMDWPPSVSIEEMNWGPIAIVQNLESLAEPYDRIILISSRVCGRPPGSITLRHWVGGLPSERNLQDRISEAVTGVISIDNLLIVGEHFKVWPKEVFLIDVEPGKEEMGEAFTPEVEAVVPEVLKMVEFVVANDGSCLDGLVEMRGDNIDDQAKSSRPDG